MFRQAAQLIGAAAVLAALAIPAIAPAAPVPANPGEAPLAAVPAQSPIVVQLRGVDRTKDRLLALIKNVVPDYAPVVAEHIETALRDGLDGRKLRGLDPAGPHFLAFLEMPTPDTDKPNVAVIARVTRFADFRDGLLTEDERKSVRPDAAGFDRAELQGQEVFFVDRGTYAVVTPSREAAALLTRKQPGLDGKLGESVGRKFLDQDLAVYVDLAAVNKEFGDQIKAARQFMETILDTMPGGNKQSIDTAKAMYAAIFQLVEDGRAFVAGFDFRPEGLALHLQTQVGADTRTNRLLREQRPSNLEALGTLPAGQTVYTAADIAPALLKTLAPIMFGISGTEDGKQAVGAALDELIAADGQVSLSAGTFPMATLSVTNFRDPQKATDAQLKLFRAMGEGGVFQNTPVKGKPEIKPNAEEYKGFKFHYARLVWDFDKLADAIPGGADAMKGPMKKLMGEDLKTWFGTDGRRYLSVSAKDWATGKATIDTYLAGGEKLATEPAFTATRTQLPAETSLLMLADAGKFTHVMADYMLAMFKAMPVLPFNLPDEVKPVATRTSYLGFASTFRPEHGSLDVFVPATAMQEIRKVVIQFAGGAQ
jgi:hypothetical protein